MLKVTKPSPQRLDIELNGTLDSDGMRRALDEIIAQSEDISSGRMLYTITNFAMPTFGALLVEFGYFPKLLGWLAKFDKCAVLSDIAWLRRAAEIEGAVLPGIEIKGFDQKETAAAEAWLME